MAAGGDGVARQAELRRIEGNVCFKKARLGGAIDCYTEARNLPAIALCPDVAIYWMNRACAISSSRALSAGVCTAREESALAIKEFEKALILLKSANSTDEMAEEIWQVLAKAKYLDWEKHSTERLWRMQSLKEACESALQEHHFLTGTLEEDSNGSSNEYSEQFKLLSEVFSQATIADTPADVPDYLCCQITFEIFRDPVITPSGVTYERATLVEHLHKVGNFDPVTREPLK
ncbi:unnamed protein product [Miscanthus lutarioriparius]|uniref:U-box domain-containing protein n=1 Tax=Miscanthus lutarioriparius TaxID=422564 RepID=A0A811RRV7_9POAL|nr:unnamed protein product [Miscanthus lutarioriparius]